MGSLPTLKRARMHLTRMYIYIYSHRIYIYIYICTHSAFSVSCSAFESASRKSKGNEKVGQPSDITKYIGMLYGMFVCTHIHTCVNKVLLIFLDQR